MTPAERALQWALRNVARAEARAAALDDLTLVTDLAAAQRDINEALRELRHRPSPEPWFG